MDGTAYRRLLLLADSHGHVHPAIVNAAHTCDCVIHAGDLGGAHVLDLVPMLAVRGNNDVPAKWPAPDHATLAALPAALAVELWGGRLVVIHGHQIASAARRHARLRTMFRDARAVLYGHSHHLLIDQSAQPWVVNPGACGRTRTKGGASCLLLEIHGPDDWQLSPLRWRS